MHTILKWYFEYSELNKKFFHWLFHVSTSKREITSLWTDFPWAPKQWGDRKCEKLGCGRQVKMHQHLFLFGKEEEVEHGRRNTVTLEENSMNWVKTGLPLARATDAEECSPTKDVLKGEGTCLQYHHLPNLEGSSQCGNLQTRKERFSYLQMEWLSICPNPALAFQNGRFSHF